MVSDKLLRTICIGLLSLQLLSCGKDQAPARSEASGPALPFTGTLYSSCFRETVFQRPDYLFFRDEYDFAHAHRLIVTRLWFGDSGCLGPAKDLRSRAADVSTDWADHNGFRTHVMTASFRPPHYEKDAIEFTARIEKRGNEVVFHLLQQFVFKGGQPAATESPGKFTLSQSAPFFGMHK